MDRLKDEDRGMPLKIKQEYENRLKEMQGKYYQYEIIRKLNDEFQFL